MHHADAGCTTPRRRAASARPTSAARAASCPPRTSNAPDDGDRPGARPTAGRGVLPAEESTETQPTRQEAAAAQTSQLPFTGFAAIPVLLGGLALLTGGLVLRRRTRSE